MGQKIGVAVLEHFHRFGRQTLDACRSLICLRYVEFFQPFQPPERFGRVA